MSVVSYLSDDKLYNLEYVKTGDIFLFSNEPQRGSLLIISSTRSVWTHVGIAVWTNDTPSKLCIFESTFGAPAYDILTGTVRKGVRLTELRLIAANYKIIHVRSSNITRDSDFYTKLDEFMNLWKGTNYVSYFKIPLIPYVCFEDPGVSCSELVARYFDYIGLFAGKPQLQNQCIKNFLPKDFAPNYNYESGDLDTTGLFNDGFCPIVYKRDHMQFDTLGVVVALTLITAVICVYSLLTSPPSGSSKTNIKVSE